MAEAFTTEVAISGAKTFDQMPVVAFRIEEGLSRPYRIEIDLVTKGPADPGDVDLDTVLQEEYGLVLTRNGTDHPFHGVVAVAEHLGEAQDLRQFYRIELVPQLWFCSLARKTQVWTETDIPTVIKDVLKAAKVSVEVKTSATYPKLPHVTQHEETDLAFVSRLMEHEGMSYWFEHSKTSHKLVIGDSASAHPAADAGVKVQFDLNKGTQGGKDSGAVIAFSKRHKVVSKEVMVRDYNAQHPATSANAKQSVSGKGLIGTVEESDYHVLADAGQAGRYAKLRSEEHASHRIQYVGESGVPALRAGGGMNLKGSDAYEGDYIILEVTHEWRDSTSGAGQAYRNRFKALSRKQLPWRPSRITPVPRISGLVTAKVKATAGHQDDKSLDGAYRINILHESQAKERIIRLAQPYAGPAQGIHFPLPQDTEVVLGHLNGHPDRPIITGALPNVENPSPVVEDNKTQCVVKSATGHTLTLEDKKDEEHVNLVSAKGHQFKLDDTKDKEQIALNSKAGHKLLFDDKSGAEKISLLSMKGHGLTFDDKAKKIAMASTKGNALIFNDDDEKVLLDAKKDFQLDSQGVGKMSFKEKLDVDGQDEITITAQKKITLKVGSASITIDSSGDITLDGVNIKITAKAKTEVSSAQAKIAGSAMVEVSGGMIKLN